jgi:anthranilate/para-aminobenzoate synthase component I
MNGESKNPDYLFEVSWEVCNKVGGIYTVISTKSLTLLETYGNNFILIGPDVYRDTTVNPEFIEDKKLFKSWRDKAAEEGLRIKVGRWNINGNPIVVIVDYRTYINQKDAIFSSYPSQAFVLHVNKLDCLSSQGRVIHSLPVGNDPLDILRQELARFIPYPVPGLPRFSGGLVGYLGYETAHFFEPTVPLSPHPDLPDADTDQAAAGAQGLLFDLQETATPTGDAAGAAL